MESEFRDFFHTDKNTHIETRYRGAWAVVQEYLNQWCSDYSVLNFTKSGKMFTECVADGRFKPVLPDGSTVTPKQLVEDEDEDEDTGPDMVVCTECSEYVDEVDDHGLCFSCSHVEFSIVIDPEPEETPVCKECFEEVDCVDEHGLCFNCHGKNPR